VATRSRVWQLSAASRSFVAKGAPILSVLSCDSVSVVALVTDRIFNKLHVGSRATFKFRESRQHVTGQVTQLRGSKFEILGDLIVTPGLVANDGDYQVLVSFSSDVAKALGDSCAIGQSGEVEFD